MITENGIYLNLDESTYILKKHGLILFFSSKFYLEKFTENIDNFIKSETLKLQNKYKINVNFEIFLTISYYKKVEKRGFKIIDEISKKEVRQASLIINSIIY